VELNVMDGLQHHAVVQSVLDYDDRLDVRFAMLAAIYRLERETDGFATFRRLLEESSRSGEPVAITVSGNRIEAVEPVGAG
jgi:hypothetical protein